MNDRSKKNPDREILETPKIAKWTCDPEVTLTDGELDGLLKYFGEFKNSDESELRSDVGSHFRTFVVMAIKERFREGDGRLVQVRKPSTIVAKQMEQLRQACEQLDQQLAQLDQATETWLDQHLKKNAVKDDRNGRVRLRDLRDHIKWPIDHLVHAAHNAEGIASRGPNNTALRVMIEGLTACWEKCHGMPPTTDRGRGRQDDPFLELCQEMARIAHVRLNAKGGGLGSLQLSGLVADVLKNRPSRTTDALREK